MSRSSRCRCFVLFYNRTRLGLYIRVVGEKPEAAEALGISITRVRYIASLLCGVLAGLAGAHLSLGYITMFTENMSSGRGFMAVAILIFSNGDPLRVLAGCLCSASPTPSRCACRRSAIPPI